MKKFTLLLSVVIILFTSCKSDWEKNIEKLSADLSKREDARWKEIMDSIDANPEKYRHFFERLGLQYDASKKHILTDSIKSYFAATYIRNYRDLIPTTVNQHGQYIDSTESVWVDGKVIAQFAKSLADGTDGIDGMRIYFAKYPPKLEIGVDPKIDETLADRNTLIFVATKNQVDYYSSGTTDNGLYIYDYNSLCPNKCAGNILGGHAKRLLAAPANAVQADGSARKDSVTNH